MQSRILEEQTDMGQPRGVQELTQIPDCSKHSAGRTDWFPRFDVGSGAGGERG